MNSQSNLERFSNLLEYFSASCSLRENCPNTENFLVRIFLYSVQIQENTNQEKLRIWTLFTQRLSYTLEAISQKNNKIEHKSLSYRNAFIFSLYQHTLPCLFVGVGLIVGVCWWNLFKSLKEVGHI